MRHGYHRKKIERGVFGELSKVREEVAEASDAEAQGNTVMLLVELSDIVGAIDGYVRKRFSGTITLADLVTMAEATRRAFDTGARS